MSKGLQTGLRNDVSSSRRPEVVDQRPREVYLEAVMLQWRCPPQSCVRSRCRYAHVLASGNAAEETIRLANDAHADLIVLGSQHKRFADASVIGSTTERVIRFAKRPVMAVVAVGI